MTTPPRDRWASSDAYEAYMGRWSRMLAREFIAWLRPAASAHWLEVGCGTGALTAAIHEMGRPASIMACDPAEPFIDRAKQALAKAATFIVMPDAETLPTRDGGFDFIVSGLVLNFMPDPARALAAMRERVRPGGTLAGYVWDYANCMELLQHFWHEATAFDPTAAAMDEGKRFGAWRTAAMQSLFEAAGLAHVETGMLGIVTQFANFDDYWKPFVAGTGPAPTYVASLDPARREELRARLQRRLPAGADGSIRLRARALSVRGTAS